MRQSLIVLLIGSFMALFCCKPVAKDDATISIDIYSVEDIAYPTKTIHIPDSIQKGFMENFFLPWELNPEELLSTMDSFPGKDLSYLEKYRNDDEWYGENKKPHKRGQREKVVNNINTESFPNFIRNGIVIAHTNLRRIPSNRPGFDTYSKAGEGFPFDYFQETNLWANTPLQLLHLSNDRRWCYVISPYYKGWGGHARYRDCF